MKKPLYKQGLFWLSVVFGVAACFFFLATMAFVDENNAIHRALARYGMYYDVMDEDVPVSDELLLIVERLSPTAQSLVDQMFADPNQVTAEDVEVLMAEVKPAAKAYLTELETYLDDYAFDNDLTTEEVEGLQESMETYRGWVNVAADELVAAYRLKESEGRSLTADEVAMVKDTLTALVTPEELDVDGPTIGQKGTSI